MTRAIRSILNIPVLWNAFLRTLNVVGSTYSFRSAGGCCCRFYFIMDHMDDSPPFLPLPLSGRGTYMGLEQCGVCECLGTQLHLVDSFFT